MATTKKASATAEKVEAAVPAVEEVKAEQPAAEAAPAAPAEEKKPAPKRGRKPAAEKAEKPAKAPKAKKTAAAEKPAKAAKTEAKTEAPKKRAAKKPAAKKTVSYEDIVEMAKKKFLAADKTRIKYPVAVNIKLTGVAEGIFYVYIDSENIYVEPYKYDDYDVEIEADAEELVKILNGKLNVYDALASDVKITGIVKKAVLFLNAAF
ncbi:MAG: hypothetical protein ACI4JF_10490 [Oscillospiraceae bacterium]